MRSFFRIGVFQVLILVLWLATLIHAGLTLWGMLATAQLPPGYQVPRGWMDLFGQGPSSRSFWFYTLVLVVNIGWESWFKGKKAYIPSNFLIPETTYSEKAWHLWLFLWGLAHLGHYEGWFAVPDWVNVTFGTCFLLLIVQDFLIRAFKSFEEYYDQVLQNESNPIGAETVNLNARVPSPRTSPVASRPRPIRSEAPSQGFDPTQTPKPAVSGTNDLSEKLLNYVRQNGQAKTGGLVGVLGSPRRTVIRNLNKLLAEGWLIREGKGPGAVYRLNVGPKEERLN